MPKILVGRLMLVVAMTILTSYQSWLVIKIDFENQELMTLSKAMADRRKKSTAEDNYQKPDYQKVWHAAYIFFTERFHFAVCLLSYR